MYSKKYTFLKKGPFFGHIRKFSKKIKLRRRIQLLDAILKFCIDQGIFACAHKLTHTHTQSHSKSHLPSQLGQ